MRILPDEVFGRDSQSAKAFIGVAVLNGMIDRRASPIDPALRSLVSVRVSQINVCPFCVDLNSATLIKRGVSTYKVKALGTWQESKLFDQREQTVLEYAEAMTRSDLDVDAELVKRLGAYFDDGGIVELTGMIAYQNMSSKFNNALGVPAQGFCKLPDGAA